MFDASIIICWLMIGGGQQCGTAEDMHSPHTTAIQCQNRLVEMQEAITTQLPSVVIMSSQCAKRETAA